MTFRLVMMIFSVAITAVSVTAQTKVVTNADLEKYRQARLTAERDYRENYERLGMPSPAELERRREQSRVETIALSEKLRNAELERERIDAQREANIRQNVVYSSGGTQNQTYNPLVYWSYGRLYRLPYRQNSSQTIGYIGGGTFWPNRNYTPPPPRPIRKHRR